jgi:hypothetical protein
VSLKSGDIPGPPSALTCPECGGALWEIGSGRIVKYRCHVGHSYTPDGLMAAQDGTLEAVLWSALRALEENASLRRRMAERSRTSKWAALHEQYERQAIEIEARADVLRKVLLSEPNGDSPANPPRQQARSTRAAAATETSRARRKDAGRPTGQLSGAAPPAGKKPAPKLAADKAAGRGAGARSRQPGGNGKMADPSRPGAGGNGRAGAQGSRAGGGEGGGGTGAKRKSTERSAGGKRRTVGRGRSD